MIGSIGNLILYVIILVIIALDKYINYKFNTAKDVTQAEADRISTVMKVSGIIKYCIIPILVLKVLLNTITIYRYTPGDNLAGPIFNFIFYIVTVVAMSLNVYKDLTLNTGFVHYWMLWVLPALLGFKIAFSVSDIYRDSREQVSTESSAAAYNRMRAQAEAEPAPAPNQGFLVEQPNESVAGATLNQRVPPPPKTRSNALMNEARQGGN